VRGDRIEELVAVVDPACAVDHEDPVAVAVQGDTKVRFLKRYLFL